MTYATGAHCFVLKVHFVRKLALESHSQLVKYTYLTSRTFKGPPARKVGGATALNFLKNGKQTAGYTANTHRQSHDQCPEQGLVLLHHFVASSHLHDVPHEDTEDFTVHLILMYSCLKVLRPPYPTIPLLSIARCLFHL